MFFLFSMIGALVSCEAADKGPPCTNQDSCVNDPKCFCWCSVACDFRKKTSEDHPMYMENDANEKFCYCKQWDYDHFQDNCVDHKDVKQPKGAQ